MWFMGTGKFAALCLENLTKNNLTLTKVITGLPTRSGRNGKENPSPVELKANELGLNVTRTGKLNDNHEILSELENPKQKPELIFVIDFGQMIKEPFLSEMCINIHPSLLPKYRGAAPIQRALLNGEKITGVTAFRLVKAMDAGEIIAQEKIEIPENFSASDLYSKLSETGCKMISEVLSRHQINFIPQDDSKATFADKIQKEEFEVNFNMTSEKFNNTVRALDMSGGAYIIFNGKRVKIWRSKIYDGYETDNPVFPCSDGKIEFCEVQAEGKKRMSGKDWAKGFRIIV